MSQVGMSLALDHLKVLAATGNAGSSAAAATAAANRDLMEAAGERRYMAGSGTVC
jgi:hypothetical protein